MLTYCHKRHKRLISLGIIAALLLPLVLNVRQAQAAALTESIIRLDNIRSSQLDIPILVAITPATVATEDHIRIIFAHTMGVDATAGNITTSTAGLPAYIQNPTHTLTPWPTIGGTAQTRGTIPCTYNSSLTCFAVDFTSADLTPGTFYGFFITAGIDTPATPGQQQHTIMTWDDGNIGTNPSNVADNVYQLAYHEEIDLSKVATRTIANNQVVITAVVPPNLSLTLNHNKTTYVDNPNNDTIFDAPGGPNPLDIDPTGYVTSQRILATVGTNALNGWSLWLKSNTSGTPALTSALTGERIPTQGNSLDGAPTLMNADGTQDFYQLEARVHTDRIVDTNDDSIDDTGVVAIDPEYFDATLPDVTNRTIAKRGGAFDDDFRQVAYADGKTDGDIVSLYSHATTRTMRAAATDYTDTWEIVACANF